MRLSRWNHDKTGCSRVWYSRRWTGAPNTDGSYRGLLPCDRCSGGEGCRTNQLLKKWEFTEIDTRVSTKVWNITFWGQYSVSGSDKSWGRVLRLLICWEISQNNINDTYQGYQSLTRRSLWVVLSVPWGTLTFGVYNHLNTSNREVLFPAGKEGSKSHSWGLEVQV